MLSCLVCMHAFVLVVVVVVHWYVLLSVCDEHGGFQGCHEGHVCESDFLQASHDVLVSLDVSLDVSHLRFESTVSECKP